MKDIRIAAVVCRSPVNQVFKTLRRMAVWVDKARDEGVDILCFPEMNVTGYSIQKEIRKVAEVIPGPITETLMELAAGKDMVLLAGMAENGKKGRIYSSHVVVRRDGEVGVYRKIHIAPPEEGFFSRGNRIPLFEAHGVNFGIQLCYDAHFPELSTAMAVKGADVVFFPHASPRGTSKDKYRSWMRHLPARAFDNGVYVVACNPVGGNGEGLDYPGLALAIGPDGCVMAKRLGKREGLLVVDLKKSALDAVRSHRMRYFLPHRRTTLFRISGALKSHKA
ncbi:MAG: nitrilase [Desulfobacterales bacterium CG07_land_8_20_14_0_80_52_14]|nr:MAG: nitrilase [Desulfobacterales bacterium CG23_combo_of_CG06-09_8_20_14_all_52_9]PIU50416.1 MAG: nitrilase [Desulfobacterales bacterium CG07_land_8_20_14_0_80_52_14]